MIKGIILSMFYICLSVFGVSSVAVLMTIFYTYMSI